MFSSISKLTKKYFFLLTLIILLSSFSFSYVIANRGDDNYDNKNEKIGNIGSGIVEGAGYFLQGYSDYLLILNRVELSDQQGIDYKELQLLVNRTIANMEKARESYAILYQQAETTPYNVIMIERLVTFDYNAFCADRGLIKSIFADTAAFLAKGDVNGLFSKLLNGTEQILSRLYIIKTGVDAGELPELAILWRLNQDFSCFLMLGQYGAEVFFANGN